MFIIVKSSFFSVSASSSWARLSRPSSTDDSLGPVPMSDWSYRRGVVFAPVRGGGGPDGAALRALEILDGDISRGPDLRDGLESLACLAWPGLTEGQYH